jgi:uncharacterized paraquat-inducible protein A
MVVGLVLLLAGLAIVGRTLLAFLQHPRFPFDWALLSLFFGFPLILSGVARCWRSWNERQELQTAADIRAGVCYNCKYDLRGNQSGRCPECGAKVEGS